MRDFRWLWAAYAVSAYGSGFGFGALPLIAVLVLDAGPAQVSVLSAVGPAVGALIALPLGPWIELRRKRPVMIATDLTRFAVMMTIPVAFAVGRLTFGQLLVVSGVVAASKIAFTAAGGAGDLLDGWRHLLGHPGLRPLFLNHLLVAGLILATEPLLAVLLLRDLGFPPWQYGLAFVRPGIVGLVTVIAVELAVIVGMSLHNPVLASYRLEHTPRHRVARTLTAWSVSSSAAIAVLSTLGGLLAAATGPRTAIAVAGGLILLSPLLLPRR